MRRIADDHFGAFLRYHRGVDRVRGLVLPRRSEFTRAVVLYGDSGVGKSIGARTAWPDAFWVPPPSATGQWWCHYDGELDVIYDEFYGQLPYALLLRLLDSTPLYLPTKGGSINFVARRMIFTSNKPPWHWYKAESVPDQQALKRRLLGQVFHCTADSVLPVEWPVFVFR